MSVTGPAGSAVGRREITGGWTVRAAAGPVPTSFADEVVAASVPGVVHLDLLAAGLIPDPYLDDNEALLAWIGLVDWTYETSFVLTAADLAAAERHELVFDGLDTVATILLNGEPLAEVANQHRSYRLDVTDRLRDGENVLTAAFSSPVRYANGQSLLLGARPRPYPMPYEAIRKSACSFGWDWGIATSTSGIWRPVWLETWGTARLDRVLVHAEPHGDGGRVDAAVRVARARDTDVTVTLDVGGVTESVVVPAGESERRVAVQLPDVDRWWPAGHGAQPLYDVRVTLSVDDEVLDEAVRRVGFRTLRWDVEPDGAGTPFQLVVNDRPIFVKGVNWIPDDAFPSRVDRARYARRLEQAKAANLNLVRVWGGGIYESDDFYDLCDELGLLTWQDFLFACAAYPEDEALRAEVEAEARENVTRLAHHASLAMLTGNNENLWGYEDWGWKERLDGRTWGALYYYELLPAIVHELAPHVPYTPGSPFSPRGEHPNAEAHGSTHLWEHWNSLDWQAYRAVRPRFVAEFGWQGPPAWSTLTRAISDDPLTPESPGMIVHQKATDGNAKLATGLLRHYRVPDDMETWHWAMQLNQANAVSCALEWFRALDPAHLRGRRLAAQRLLAGHLLGGHRWRRTREAPLLRPAELVRAAPGHPPTPRRRSDRGPGQRHRQPMAGRGPGHPPTLRRAHPRLVILPGPRARLELGDRRGPGSRSRGGRPAHRAHRRHGARHPGDVVPHRATRQPAATAAGPRRGVSHRGRCRGESHSRSPPARPHPPRRQDRPLRRRGPGARHTPSRRVDHLPHHRCSPPRHRRRPGTRGPTVGQ